MGFSFNRPIKSKSGKIIASSVYTKLVQKGKLGNEEAIHNPKLNNDAVFLYLLIAAFKWLFWSGTGLRRVFWAVVIGLGTGLLLGSGGLFICSNVFGLWMWSTIAASSAFGSILAERELAAETSLKKALEE